jgi:hypothetical protein
MQLPDEAKAQGARPSWMGYISSADVDAEVSAVSATGGQDKCTLGGSATGGR